MPPIAGTTPGYRRWYRAAVAFADYFQVTQVHIRIDRPERIKNVGMAIVWHRECITNPLYALRLMKGRFP